MDPFALAMHEKWWAFLQTEEGEKLKTNHSAHPSVEQSLSERIRFEAWADDVLNRMSRDIVTRVEKK